jgi:hypothetical protein
MMGRVADQYYDLHHTTAHLARCRQTRRRVAFPGLSPNPMENTPTAVDSVRFQRGLKDRRWPAISLESVSFHPKTKYFTS